MRDKHTSRVTAPRRREEGRRARSPAKDGKPDVSMSAGAPGRAGRGAQRPVRTMADRQDRGRVFIQLSEEQVDRVIDSTAQTAPSERVLGGLIRKQPKRSGKNTQWLFSTLMEDRSLSHSL